MNSNVHNLFKNYKQYVCNNENTARVNLLFMSELPANETVFSRIEQVLNKKGISNPEFQDKLGIQSQHWTNWRNRGVPAKRLLDISRFLDVSLDWLATGKGSQYGDYIDGEAIRPSIVADRVKHESNAEWLGCFDVWDSDTPLDDDEVALPFFREVKLSAGSGRSSEVIENHGFKLRFAKSTLRKAGVQYEHAYCVTVAGNSMEPVLPNGCTIGINTIDTAIQDGKVYAVDQYGELRVKLLYKFPGGSIRVRSYNHFEYPDETVTGQDLEGFKILGRMFWYSVLL